MWAGEAQGSGWDHIQWPIPIKVTCPRSNKIVDVAACDGPIPVTVLGDAYLTGGQMAWCGHPELGGTYNVASLHLLFP